MNLVGNAVKFTSHGEVVVRADVTVADEDRAVARISVTDTGIGMDEAAVKRIFEPFSQADETTTRKFGGTGLGLAICRELSDIMGGEITVESTPQVRLDVPSFAAVADCLHAGHGRGGIASSHCSHPYTSYIAA